MIQQAVAAQSKIGLECKEFIDQNQPGELHPAIVTTEESE